MRFAQRAGTGSHQREENALEPRGGLVETLLQRVEQMHIELLGFRNVFSNAIQHNHLEKLLCGRGRRGDENPSSFVDGIGGPVLGLGDLENGLPVGHRWEDLEWFGKLAGLIAGENESNPRFIELVKDAWDVYTFIKKNWGE